MCMCKCIFSIFLYFFHDMNFGFLVFSQQNLLHQKFVEVEEVDCKIHQDAIFDPWFIMDLH